MQRYNNPKGGVYLVVFILTSLDIISKIQQFLSDSSMDSSAMDFSTSPAVAVPLPLHVTQEVNDGGTSLIDANVIEQAPVIDLQEPISFEERRQAFELLQQAKDQTLTPLRPIDREQYTVRINTYRRNLQLQTSVNHLLTCPGIAQIQIVWCDSELDPPIFDDPKVVVERHEVNSLNERFHILEDSSLSPFIPPTLGILSIDDDVLRPCEAMDAGFFKWTDSPEYMVGYDIRSHVAMWRKEQLEAENVELLDDGDEGGDFNNDGMKEEQPMEETLPKWSYGPLSISTKTQKYSLVLPRFAFLHADYLKWYTHYIPPRIRKIIDQNLSCEDIAMSFFISSLNGGEVPLLADRWAISSQVKLNSGNKISSGSNHQELRNMCVDQFGFLLGLKDGFNSLVQQEVISNLKTTQWGDLRLHPLNYSREYGGLFGIGAHVEKNDKPLIIRDDFIDRRKELVVMVRNWLDKDHKETSLKELIRKVRVKANEAGLLE
jgi:glucuronyl/N-acetylglucosaminyl transferase EXT2